MSVAVAQLVEESNGRRWLAIECPGCGFLHGPTVERGSGDDALQCWTWNGSLSDPTLTPSLLLRAQHPALVCHSYVLAGRMHFLRDCTHLDSGRTVAIQALPVAA